MKKLSYVCLFVLILICCVLGYLYYFVSNELKVIDTARTPKTALYVVKNGMKLSDVYTDIFDSKKLVNKYVFRYWVKQHPSLTNIKAGTYEILENSTFAQILELFVSGKVKTFNVTLIEGTRLVDFFKVLKNNNKLKHELPDDLKMEDLSRILKIKDYVNLEGLFMPDTYVCQYGDSDLDILIRAYNTMDKFLATEYEKRAENLPYKNAYEALIMASIIEKETSLPSERKNIASVFVNRLHKGMKLQTDPTVIYGVGDRYKGKIFKSFLEDKNPYNTYVIEGLPPTPIAMPGREAIISALHPNKTPYLFFVAKGINSKQGHVFSKNEKEHMEAVAKYRKEVNAYKEGKLKNKVIK
ncbi:MAG: endolytic transglycosylase MltG [Succinivibrionaceae bacterium]